MVLGAGRSRDSIERYWIGKPSLRDGHHQPAVQRYEQAEILETATELRS
jgi:hypothetical protein